MKAFPMFIKTTGRRVIIVGGGEQAAQKARLMLKTDAQIVFAALELDAEIEGLVEDGRATWYKGAISEEFFAGAAMVFVATGCFAIDVSAHAIAKSARCPVNVVDQPDLCDITTPSLVDRDPVVVAIGTEGTCPVLARQIKTQIEEQLPQNLGGLAALAGRLRGAVAKNVARRHRRSFWRWVFAGPPAQMWHRGVEAHAASAIKEAIAAGGTIEEAHGALAVLDPGCGARDLQTLRAVQRLQEADVIFYDRARDEEILELARRDAERVCLSQVQNDSPWSQDWMAATLMKELKHGHKIVWLTSRTELAQGVTERSGAKAEFVPGLSAATALQESARRAG